LTDENDEDEHQEHHILIETLPSGQWNGIAKAAAGLHNLEIGRGEGECGEKQDEQQQQPAHNTRLEAGDDGHTKHHFQYHDEDGLRQRIVLEEMEHRLEEAGILAQLGKLLEVFLQFITESQRVVGLYNARENEQDAHCIAGEIGNDGQYFLHVLLN